MAGRGEDGAIMIEPMSPLARLLCAYAPPARRAAYRLIWAYDERLAALVRSTTQPMIGQMRIAWWDEVLAAAPAGDAGMKGAGDPLVDALRAEDIAQRPGLARMLDGWEALLETPLDEEALLLFAQARGGGLFAALADSADDDGGWYAAGGLWALWDLAAHLSPEDLVAARAMALARRWLDPVDAMRWDRADRPLQIATRLAWRDVARGTVPQPGLTPARYVRLLRIATLGR
ncbi:MAG: hypothetical protein ABW164_12180 [Sphingobium sp.]